MFPSNISDPMIERTLESTPGPIQNLILIPEAIPTQPRSINVTWMPPKKRDENGVIISYRIICKSNTSDATMEYVKFRHREAQSILIENLTAEIPYYISVSANTSVGFGTPVENSTEIKSGGMADIGLVNGAMSKTPLPPKMILKKSTVEVTEPRRQLAINLPISDFFCNLVYGSQHKAGVIVAQSSRTDENIYKGNFSYYISTVIKNYRSWSDVHDSDNVPPYRATSDDWKPPVECAGRRRCDSDNNEKKVVEDLTLIC
ncbi:hypothetical protein CHS0354_007421 [Potamilus streckersoni]|uniref:Fibronectin type-III domain-containing protein n=1 Tax=Potamilus streckersoni TaxID=2493646 RepID=A0AAE0SVQ6_9BIVA|nr:hypothetical protein CHS0354_007421 [Potamilus streckersoni]